MSYFEAPEGYVLVKGTTPYARVHHIIKEPSQTSLCLAVHGDKQQAMIPFVPLHDVCGVCLRRFNELFYD